MDLMEVSTEIYTKFTSSLMGLWIECNEGHVIPPYFFLQGLRINATAYIVVLDMVIKPWVERVVQRRLYLFFSHVLYNPEIDNQVFSHSSYLLSLLLRRSTKPQNQELIGGTTM